MSTSGVADHAVTGQTDRGYRFGLWSLLMLPFLVLSGLVAGITALFILGSADLEGSEPMAEQGATGWTALIVSWVLFMTPMFVGLFLGAKARRLGERRLGTIGMVVDGAILVLYTIAAFGGALTQ